MTIFSQYGEIMDVHNVKDRETGKFRWAPLHGQRCTAPADACKGPPPGRGSASL